MNALVMFAAILFAQVPALTPQAQNGVATGQVRSPSGVPASGVRVAAMVLPDPNAPAGGGALVSLAESDSAGRYRLENIPPGRYYIQAGLIDFPSYYPGVAAMTGAMPVQITAGAIVEGLDFTLTRPSGVRVTGRVPLSISPRPQRILMSGGSVGGVGANNVTINADGSFEFLRVTPGNYTIMASPNNGLPNLPIVVNDKDIDIGIPTGVGVKVSGVVGLGAASPKPGNQRVILTGSSSAWAQVETVINTSGRFEFPNVPAGSYAVRTLPGPSAALSTIVVADREIAGLVLPGFVEIPGRVLLADGSSLPAFSSALMIEAKRVNATTLATAAQRDGTFRLPLVEGEYRISFGKLPPGVSVKSMSYGSTDLLTSPLKLDGASVLTGIRLTLEMK